MIYFILVLLALYFLRADYRLTGFHADYAAPNTVLPVKGVFISLVFLSHFCNGGYGVALSGPADATYGAVQRFLGQMIVVPFLFYSGFGVVERIRAAGDAYLRTFVVKRLVKTVVLFDLAVALYMVVRHVVSGASFPPVRMLLNFLGWTSAGNSNWYIFTIVLLYFATYLSFVAFRGLEGRRRDLCSVAGVTVLAFLLVGALSSCRPDYVYNTVFAFVAGCWFSLFRPVVEEILLARLRTWLFGLGAAVAGTVLLNPFRGTTACCELLAVVFAAGIVLLTARVRSNSRILAFAGRHLFSLYILQRLPMLLLKGTTVAQNRYVYVLLCGAATVVLAVAFDFVTARVWDLLEKGWTRLVRARA